MLNQFIIIIHTHTHMIKNTLRLINELGVCRLYRRSEEADYYTHSCICVTSVVQRK